MTEPILNYNIINRDILYWIKFPHARAVIILAAFAVFFSCTGEREQGSVEKLMIKAAIQYDDSILKAPYSAPAFYMEAALCEGKYCMYTDAAGYIFSQGYDYEIQPANFVFIPANMRKSDRNSLWLQNMSYWYADAPDIAHQSDFPPGYTTLFSSFRWFEMRGPLGNPRSYAFNMVDTVFVKETDKNQLNIEFRPEGEHQYSGTLYLHKETLLPYRVVMDRIPLYSQTFRQWVSAESEIIYHTDDNYVSISSISFRFIKNQIEYWIEVKVSSKTKQFNSVERSESLALEYSASNPFVQYKGDEPDWPVQFASRDYDQIRSDLEGERSLERQYVSNAGQYYYSRTYQGGREVTVFGGEETYRTIQQILAGLQQEFYKE